MPRQRMVKPEFFDSESLANCPIEARLAFIGLWVMADDHGNCILSVRKLKRQIFPFDEMDDDEFAEYLVDLEDNACIKGYEVDGERFINIPNFGVYQTVNRPSKSTIPEPPEKVAQAKRTTTLKAWLSDAGAITECSVSSEDSVSTHAKEVSNEGREVVVLQQQLPQEASGAAEAEAPPSASKPVCPLCRTAVRYDVRGSTWECPNCGAIKAPEYAEWGAA